MNITILCSKESHPVNDHLVRWTRKHGDEHEIVLVRRQADLSGGDILFLVSCSEIIGSVKREKYGACLVLHASDLPNGRGWSPHIWEILSGAETLTVCLLEAGDEVDSGAIWSKVNLSVPKSALWDEINQQLFEATILLMDYAVKGYETISPQPQDTNIKPTYYHRRDPEHSRLDPNQTLTSQFDLIRVCDPERFPAFFEIHGQRYTLRIEKMDRE